VILQNRSLDAGHQPEVLICCVLGIVASFVFTAVAAGLAAFLCALLIADRRHCWTPGRLVLLWQYINLILAPAIDGGWPSPTWISALVGAVAFLSHAAYVILSPERTTIAAHLESLRRVELRTCLGLGLVGGGSMLYLMSIGAFEHLGGKITIDAPFKGVASLLKTLLYPALAILGLRWQSCWRSSALALILIITAGLGSLMSGRKEDVLISLGTFALFTYVGSGTVGKRTAIALACCAIVGLGALSFIYEMRRHYFFFVPGYNATITEVLRDTLDDRNLVPGYEYSIWSRLNHLEPTERYLLKGIDVLGPGEFRDIFAYSLTPGSLKGDGAEQLQPSFIFGYRFGYATFYGDTAISAGPVVEFHDLLGWVGLVFVILMPSAIDHILKTGMYWRSFGLLVFWILLLRALTYERFLIHFISLLPAMLLPFVLGFHVERLLLRRPFLFSMGLPPAKSTREKADALS